MLNKRWMAKGIALCACVLMTNGFAAVAEEKRLGDFIYVPAMRVESMAGTISLQVEGVTLEQESDTAVLTESLSGAEFGVYVISGDGEVTPWANPLYPSEPMRIRTGEGETRFSLPQGVEFYLRQESAPQGYLFDSDALIPVTGDAITIRNETAGELVLCARDSLGMPLSGVEMRITDESGAVTVLHTDEEGEAVYLCDRAAEVSVSEGALPEGVFGALGVSGAMQDETGALSVQVARASRARVVFEHPASGTVQLAMTLEGIDANAQETALPLADVRLDVLSDPPVSILTDETGTASASLLEGLYDVRLSYEGGSDVILPISEGQMIVESGSTTLIELSALEAKGRVSLIAQAAKRVSGGLMTLQDGEGRTYGPYALDAEGMAVSEALPAGVYRVSEFTLPQGTELAGASLAGSQAASVQGMEFAIEPGRLVQIEAHLLTREKQTFGLYSAQVDEQGDAQYAVIGEALELTLLDGEGKAAAQLNAENGRAEIEALSGSYTLAMEEKMAAKLGVLPVSGVFELPSDEENVIFSGDRARLMIAAVDENGKPVAGGRYAVTDSEGSRYEILCDEDGLAVTPLAAAGEATVETLQAPKGYDGTGSVMTAQLAAGSAAHMEIEHPSFGSARFSVRVKSLDERGQEILTPLAGMSVHLLRVSEDGQQATDLGVVLTSDEAGSAEIRLEKGEYIARIDAQDMSSGWRAPQALRFVVENTKTFEGELVCMDALGGVRARITGGELDDMQLAQVRFELEDSEGGIHELTMHEGTFYAGGLTAGNYVLRQTQIPQGYNLAQERTVSVAGGEAVIVNVPLEEYAVVAVSKTGLTFDDAFRTYVVPLTGEYGVYTMDGGEMKPYPSAAEQMTVWANVTPEQIAEGRADSAKLPASMEGTTYYLHELGGAKGFAGDENYYEIVLRAGEERVLECAVSSDRGFFSFDMTDAADGSRVSGGEYELLDAGGETILSFTLGEEAYRNQMAVEVGMYTLRQKTAAEGYALSSEPEIDLEITPYLAQGGTITTASMTSARIPQNQDGGVLVDLYAASEQGLTLVTVDGAAFERGHALHAPQMTIRVSSGETERTDIASVVLSGVSDDEGGAYQARVEYCLAGGGWQPSDARLTGVIAGPTAVSLDDVQDDISAVRVTYLNAETGEEIAGSGFMPGQTSIAVEASAQGAVQMHAEAEWTSLTCYLEAHGETEVEFGRRSSLALDFEMHSGSPFETVSAGRDGRISGVAFFDEDADGLMDADETGRYAGMTVTLMTRAGDIVDSVRTGTDGSYAFSSISSGEYEVQFDAGEQVVFSRGRRYSAHGISAVEDTRYGMSGTLTIDGDHTDHLVNVGCIYAAGISGAVLEQTAEDVQEGFGGLSVEMRMAGAAQEEPMVVMTDDMGAFGFSRLLPGRYDVTVHLPQGYLCREAEDGVIRKTIELHEGDTSVFGAPVLHRAAALSGRVRIDDDGDGVMPDDASGLSGVRVSLIREDGGYAERIADTTTDEQGAYSFANLYPDAYSVLFELDGEWAFTRYGEDSGVYGAVSQSGSTKTIALAPGEEASGVDAGVTIPAQMSVTVFKDTQYDGQKGVYEEYLEDVSVSLIRLENGEDAEAVTYTTDAEGNVYFAGVSPGEYVLAYQMPGQWRATRQVDPQTTNYPVSCVPQSAEASGRSEPFTLTMGQSGVRMYIGAMLSGSISGTVYYDDNADAQMGEGESTAADIAVELLDSSDAVIAKTYSASNGSYAFEGLAPARYRVRFTAPQGCGFSGTARTQTRGGVMASDENVSATKLISAVSGTATDTAHAGIVRLAAISGVIWEDRNADCMQDPAERGMEGVMVNLMDGAGRIIRSDAMTDSEGRFAFEGVRPGDYLIRTVAPEGYVFSGALAGSALPLAEERDGRGYSAPFTMLGGAHAQGIGFGLLTQGSISGLVWEDESYDGVMDADEAGLRGVIVSLMDAEGREIASEKTIRSGEFSFERLMPGEYSLRVTLEDGYMFTAEGAQSIAPQDGLVAEASIGLLEMGGTISDVRIGALKPAVVGGFAWLDKENDGRRTGDGDGMQGVRAILTMESGADAGKVYAATTGEDGMYRFEGIMPGDARIAFELPQGYAFGRKIAGSRRVSAVETADSLTAQTDSFSLSSGESRMDIDACVVGVGSVNGIVWEDGAYNGRRDNSEGGVPGATVELVNLQTKQTAQTAQTDEHGAFEIGFVRMGEYSLRVTLPEGMIFTCGGAIADVDADMAQSESFALAMGESRTGMEIGAIIPARMSGSVIVDSNENGMAETGEAGLSGAVITAMQGGTAVASTRTDENGAYSFDMLRPGTYRLRFALDEDTLFARGVQLKLTEEDAMEGETGEYTLAMGQQQPMDPVSVVHAAEISGRAWMDEDVSGSIGEEEAAMPGVLIELMDENGRVIDAVDSEEDGRYAFLRLRSGRYALRFTLEDGVLLTDCTGDEEGSIAPVVPGSVGQTDVFALAMGERKTANIGGILPGRIGDTVWLDTNGNGLQDYKEPLIPGVTLTLLTILEDGSYEPAETLQSDEYGYYSFEALRPGLYALRVELAEGDVLTFRFGEPLGEIDSDTDPETGVSEHFALRSGQALRNIDVGFVEKAQ